MTRLPLLRAFGRLGLASLVLAWLVLPAPAAEKLKVTIPASAVTFASLYHAQAAGYFKKDVELIGIGAGPAARVDASPPAPRCARRRRPPGPRSHDRGQRGR